MGTVLLLAFQGVKKGLKWSAGLLLLEYLGLLIALSVVFRMVHAERAFYYAPFWSYRAIRGGEASLLTQVVANVVAFIPIGLLLGFSLPRPKWWKVLLIGGAFSLLIETLQFVLRRGFSDFDDVFHNVVGCLVGYGMYVGIDSIMAKHRRNPR